MANDVWSRYEWREPAGLLPGEVSDEVEGEYRYVDESPEEPSVRVDIPPVNGSVPPSNGSGRTGRTPEEEEAMEEALKAKIKLKRTQVAAKTAEAEHAITKGRKAEQELRKAKYELGRERRKESFAMAGRLSKVFAPVGTPGGMKRFYLGGAKDSLYVPKTPSAEALRMSPAGGANKPRLESLRQRARLGTPQARPIDVSYARRLVEGPRHDAPLSFGFLRDLTLPSGTSRLEQAVFAEVRSNHDVDTMAHIKAVVGQLGFSGPAIERAVRSLEQKGLIEKQKALPGEVPVYTT